MMQFDRVYFMYKTYLYIIMLYLTKLLWEPKGYIDHAILHWKKDYANLWLDLNAFCFP